MFLNWSVSYTAVCGILFAKVLFPNKNFINSIGTVLARDMT